MKNSIKKIYYFSYFIKQLIINRNWGQFYLDVLILIFKYNLKIKLCNSPFKITLKEYKIINRNFIKNRNHNFYNLIKKSYSDLVLKPEKEITLKVITEDFPGFNYNLIAFCKTIKQNKIKLIPNHVFWAWPEIGVYNYEILINELVELSKKKPEFDTLFWAGNINSHNSRQAFFSQFKNHKLVTCFETHANKLGEINASTTKNYQTLQEHTKYKYLIDIQGYAYSYRLPYLLFMGRPLFIQDNKWISYTNQNLIPYTHFIPVKEDFSDLEEQLNWAELNYDKALEIAMNGQQFAINHLTQEAAIKYIQNQFLI